MKKLKRIEIRVDAIEKQAIKKRARDAGLSVGEYLRNLGLRKTIHYKLTPEELAIYQDLKKFYNNFSYISNYIKSKHPGLVNLIQVTQSQIRQHLKKLEK